LQLIGEGKTNKEIAQHLGMSVKTVESHRANLMKKLAVHETAGLVRHAIKIGLIQP
jgi:DNA-binding NarL/FixJ family response regulator